ncbi:putative F-box/kelch-repeat protein At3g17570 [Silene latifolia]|uniref:putative F-box/kelch-repeat protein At3g17570 n=1 Tax=Silene latifolia TaxID=37657 RepID=UPI003D787551
MVKGYLDCLPCEILHNIALMLPFSSIIQLKCSSKFLYNLLTDPKFVDLHLAHALQEPPGYLFTPIPKSWSEKKACYFVEQSGDQLSTSKIFESPCDYFEPENWGNYFQSSGGLMCAYSSQSCCFRIFNPHIAEEVQVPRDSKFKKWWFINFVFSYSPSIKEYKILKMGELICGRPVAEICTLGSNIWREIVENVPNTNWHTNRCTYCQGNPFWIDTSNIHFFDLVSEKFHVIPGPPVLEIVRVTNDSATRVKLMTKTLISMGDTIGYLHNNRLWVLEDKTKGIWINRYDFSIPPLYNWATLTGTTENGHLFGYMRLSTNVFSHDMGCTGFRVMEMNLDNHGSKEKHRTSC